MKFKVLQDNLAAAGTLIMSTVAKNSSLAVLNMAVIERFNDNTILLRSTNLETYLEIMLPVKMQVDGEPGEGVCVPVDLFQYVAKLDKESPVTVEIDGTKITVSTPDGQRVLQGVDNAEAPMRPQNEFASFQIDNDLLNEVLTRTAYAVAADSTARAALGGVHLVTDGDHVAAEATDGFRGARVEFEAGYHEPLDVNIPASTLRVLTKLFKVSSGKTSIATNHRSQVSFEIEGARVVSQLIDAAFPDMSPIWPTSHQYQAEIMPESVGKHVDRVTAGMGKGHAVKVLPVDNLDDGVFQNKLRLETVSEGQVSEAVFNTMMLSGEIRAADLLAVNANYLVEALNTFDGSANLSYVDRMTPIVLEENHLPEGLHSSRHLVMPLHFNR